MERKRVRLKVSTPVVEPTPVAPPRVRQALSSITTSVVHKRSGVVTAEKTTTDHVAMKVSQPHGNIGVSGKITTQTEPFCSISVGISLNMPCEPTFEAATEMYDKCSKWVEEKLLRERDLALGVDVD